MFYIRCTEYICSMKYGCLPLEGTLNTEDADSSKDVSTVLVLNFITFVYIQKVFCFYICQHFDLIIRLLKLTETKPQISSLK